jgi:hypothetical protein
MLLAGGIAMSHYVPAITSGQPYTVTDSTTGRVYTIHGSIPLKDASGVPRSYPTSAMEGHALAATTTIADGTPVVVDFLLRWNPEAETLNGGSGVFEVVSADVHQVGAGPVHATFEKRGEYWTRIPSP